jgi:3-oxoacyl-[acyl-carrier protein] reductase
MPDLDFTGQVAVVTGASRGIGRVIALGLAKRGATVVGTARQMDSSPGTGGTLRETFDMIAAAGGKGLPIASSITEPAPANALIERAVSEFGRIDMLINNAGVLPPSSITSMTNQEWDDLIAINVTAVFLLTRDVIPIMKQQGTGHIIGVSSGAGATRPKAIFTGYGASKGAIDRMYFNLAEELKGDGIAVNIWQPGMLNTDINAARPGGDDVAIVEPSMMWLAAQTAESFTGNNVRREDFGKTWGQDG